MVASSQETVLVYRREQDVGHLRPPEEIEPEIPKTNALTTKLLSERPEHSPRSAAELINELEKILNGKDPAAAVAEPLSDRKTVVMDPDGKERTGNIRAAPPPPESRKR